jgi:SAM-dependent methyltransferase
MKTSPQIYEQMSNFAARLPREGKFIRETIGPTAASAIDCGCGPGHHAAMMAQWGLNVLGIDASASMIRRAKEHYGKSKSLGWRVLRFDRLDRLKIQFDALICMGNALLQAGEKADVAAAVRRFSRRLNPGGKLVLHIPNLSQYTPGKLYVRSTNLIESNDEKWLMVKLMERDRRRATMRLVRVDSEARQAGETIGSSAMAVFDRAWLTDLLKACGLRRIRLYGGFDGSPYRSRSSPDMITTAEISPISRT